ncbi:MAG: tetratricopeptide repeat protein, partial [Candidatus Margulisiibacteriota bacterium]
LAMTYAYSNNIIDGMSELRKTNDIDPNYRLRALPIYIGRVTQSPNDWKQRFRLAFVYFANGKKQDAIREFENVLVIDPYNVWAYGYLALIYGEMGNIDKGIEMTKKGLSIDKNVAAMHLLLSEGYYKKGDSWGGWAERFEALRLKAIGY